jgi:hypothetical protein
MLGDITEEKSMPDTTPGAPGLPPPNWYTDPADPARERYWAGTQWTDHLRYPAPSQPPISASFSQPQAYRPMASHSLDPEAAIVRPPLRGSPNTLPIWFIATYPIWGTLVQVPFYFNATREQAAAAVFPAWIASMILVLLATIWDGSILRRRNLPAPSVAWLFLSLIAYLIARRVILRRAGVRSNAPGNVFAGIILAYLVLAIGIPAWIYFAR